MLLGHDSATDWYDWNTDDWDSVDWSNYWDRILTARLEAAASGTRTSGRPVSSQRSRRTSFDDRVAVSRHWCETGSHYWTRPLVRGRAPASCPLHDAAGDPGHPSSDPSCFHLDSGWSLRLEVTYDLRHASQLLMPDSLAAAIGMAPQQLTDAVPARGLGSTLQLWRGRGTAWCRGAIGRIVPRDAMFGDFLFLSFDLPRYTITLTRPTAASPQEQIAAFVGLPPGSPVDPRFWDRVARRLGVSPRDPRELIDLARTRGDPELEAAVSAAVRGRVPAGGWATGWDLVGTLEEDDRFLAVTSGRSCRVAVGIADPRDRLSDEYLVTPGGLVWVEVDAVEEAIAARSDLLPDIVTPALSERWVEWMRLEHLARRLSLSGREWRIAVDESGRWCVEGGGRYRDLVSALDEIAMRKPGSIREPRRQKHVIPRSAIAVDRAIQRARAASLATIESDASVGFASRWHSGLRTASSILGTLILD